MINLKMSKISTKNILKKIFKGKTDKKVKKKVSKKKVVKDKKIIIHNAPFDLGFLNGELGLLNKKSKIDVKLVIDSLEVARNKFPGTSNSLDALCKKFNIDLSKRTKHNALLDCELLREVYINLLDAKEPKFDLSNISEAIRFNKTNDYNKTIVKIPEDEIKKHKDFLKSELRKNFYWTFLILYNFLKSTVSFIFTSLKPEFSNKKIKIFLN